MFKLIFCLRRLPHLSREEFQQYWRQRHAPLVQQYAAALRMRRYVQSHTLTIAANEALQSSRDSGEPYDGVAEVWWDSMTDLGAALRTPEGRQADRALREDERRFIDLERSSLWFSNEQTIFGDRPERP